MHRNRLLSCAALAAAGVLALAGPAAAHVTVDPSEAGRGGYSTVNFKVPNERDDASTVRLEVHLDPGHPVASVMPQPVPGWEVEVEVTELDEPLEVHGRQITEAPSRIVWSGGEIRPGMFQQFPVSMGRLPEDADRLVFKAIQTYDSDEVVRWIEEPAEDGSHPDHPAAVLELVASGNGHDSSGGDGHDSSGGDDDTAAHDTAADGGHGASGETAAASTTDTTARVMAVVGILAGAAGVAFGLLARRRPGAS
ncbi:YcnI family protein [Streptomyces sodiiphilus]|uniref:YcnI family protein n=1 Tax=Streptomyces sodiiphilus TaxID=226217 RepID=A0ABN2PQ44_9ACTN